MKNSKMRAALFSGFVLLLWANVGRVIAQGISPVIVEYQEKAKGSFEVRNDTIYPLSVVREPFSFSVSQLDAGNAPSFQGTQIVIVKSR